MKVTTTIVLGWLFISIIVIILTFLMLVSQPGDVSRDNSIFPQVTRTFNGTPSVVMPEDLDRTS